jgi:hypothetical protein
MLEEFLSSGVRGELTYCTVVWHWYAMLTGVFKVV